IRDFHVTGVQTCALPISDKNNYPHYYEAALALLRPGGMLLIDNVLWGGDVADPAATDQETTTLRDLNTKVKADARVEFCLLPIRSEERRVGKEWRAGVTP